MIRQGVTLQNDNEGGNPNRLSDSHLQEIHSAPGDGQRESDLARKAALKEMAAQIDSKIVSGAQNGQRFNPIAENDLTALDQQRTDETAEIASSTQLKPYWDETKRELRFAGKVVKRFKWPAKNQLRVLLAFENQNWPREIDNPLPPSEKICSKTQLHDTIKCLNRHQVNKLVKFHGNGTGKGVYWTIVEPANRKTSIAPNNGSGGSCAGGDGQPGTAGN